MIFLDTNVLVYFGETASPKFARAAALIEAGGVVSVQVLNEFANVTRRKNKLSWDRISQALALIRGLLDVRPLTIVTHETALDIAERHKLHFYDALIVSAALEANCDILYSEDMQHGLLVENRLRIVNPFAAA